MNTALFEFLKSRLPEECIKRDEPMGLHTTFRVGGNADFFLEISSPKELADIIKYLKQTEHSYFILGNGSNLLVGDKGYDGVILHLGERFSGITVEKETITVQAGALLSTVAKTAAKHGLAGMEFASGIPGTIGGAVVMNAGAYEGEMKQIITMVTVMTDRGEILELDNETMEFGYRTSIIKNRPFIVLSARLDLKKGNIEEIQEKMDDFGNRRRSKQPLEYPSAGSTFKRPEGYFAGKLIMDAGFRGYRIGGAQVSEKHCGFIINVGNATAADISELMDEVIEKVKDKFDVTLEPEIIRIGNF
ncbi:MAG: UDP-N-acetylmuramate dehydrogenase [Lachnospiraceae bacterium]|nr:UDP-N-acetylmuramate dehydrogenase [Lachnospiraceae bacterium]